MLSTQGCAIREGESSEKPRNSVVCEDSPFCVVPRAIMKRVLAYYTAGWVRIGRYFILGVTLSVVNLPLAFLLSLCERDSFISPIEAIVLVIASALYLPFTVHWASDRTHQLTTPVLRMRAGNMGNAPTPFPSHRKQTDDHPASSS
jgi:hypothetical protein